MAANSEKLHRMKELVEKLREASMAYYAQDKEIMSNFEYDNLYDELAKLEQETGPDRKSYDQRRVRGSG